jgi:voltage-gated potassium channel
MLMLVITAFVLIAITIIIHGVGTTSWIRYLLARPGIQSLRVVISTAIVLITLHLVEILVWALAYMLMLPTDELQSLEASLYFSAVTFTTLGYGDITLSSDWRLLSGLEAIDGILLIGWSTAFLFAVLQRTWQIPGDTNN